MKAVLVVLALSSNGQGFVREELLMTNVSLCKTMAEMLDKAASEAAVSGETSEVALATCKTVESNDR